MDEDDVEILLVEGNPDDEESVMQAIKKNNISNTVHVSRDGVEALEYLFGSVDGNDLRDNCPKLILLGIKIPKIDGIDVLKKIKSHSGARKIPVVILISSDEEKEMLDVYGLDVDSHIRKPVDFKRYSEAVRQIGMYRLPLNKQPEQ